VNLNINAGLGGGDFPGQRDMYGPDEFGENLNGQGGFS
jgi:hypothetical protein